MESFISAQVLDFIGDHAPDRTGDLQFRKTYPTKIAFWGFSSPIKLRTIPAPETFWRFLFQFVSVFQNSTGKRRGKLIS